MARSEEEEHKYDGLTIGSWVGIGIGIVAMIIIITLAIYIGKKLAKGDVLLQELLTLKQS